MPWMAALNIMQFIPVMFDTTPAIRRLASLCLNRQRKGIILRGEAGMPISINSISVGSRHRPGPRCHEQHRTGMIARPGPGQIQHDPLHSRLGFSGFQ